jgi:hypothetical protein
MGHFVRYHSVTVTSKQHIIAVWHQCNTSLQNTSEMCLHFWDAVCLCVYIHAYNLQLLFEQFFDVAIFKRNIRNITDALFVSTISFGTIYLYLQ